MVFTYQQTLNGIRMPQYLASRRHSPALQIEQISVFTDWIDLRCVRPSTRSRSSCLPAPTSHCAKLPKKPSLDGKKLAVREIAGLAETSCETFPAVVAFGGSRRPITLGKSGFFPGAPPRFVHT